MLWTSVQKVVTLFGDYILDSLIPGLQFHTPKTGSNYHKTKPYSDHLPFSLQLCKKNKYGLIILTMYCIINDPSDKQNA